MFTWVYPKRKIKNEINELITWKIPALNAINRELKLPYKSQKIIY
jgi:hypothetical protein